MDDSLNRLIEYTICNNYEITIKGNKRENKKDEPYDIGIYNSTSICFSIINKTIELAAKEAYDVLIKNKRDDKLRKINELKQNISVLTKKMNSLQNSLDD